MEYPKNFYQHLARFQRRRFDILSADQHWRQLAEQLVTASHRWQYYPDQREQRYAAAKFPIEHDGASSQYIGPRFQLNGLEQETLIQSVKRADH